MNLKKMLVLAVAALAAACEKHDTPQNVIPIGAIIDRTGSVAVPIWPAEVKLAFDDANTGLLATGRDYSFGYEISDSTNNAAVSVQRAKDLVQNSGVKALILDTTRDDIAVNALNYNADGTPTHAQDVPVVAFAANGPTINNPAATDPDPATQFALHNGLGWNFRMAMSSVAHANIMMKVARRAGVNHDGDANGDGHFKIAVYATNESFGKGFANNLVKALKAADPNATAETILFDPTVDPNSYNWDADIARLTDTYNETTKTTDGAPDIVFSISGAQLGSAFKTAWVEGGQTIRVMHNSSFRTVTTLQRMPPGTAEGSEGVGNINTDGISGDIFLQELQAVGAGVPESIDAMLYDASMSTLLATMVAVEQNHLTDPTQVTGTQIRDALRLINDPSGELIRPGPDQFAKAVEAIAAGKTINYDGASGPVDLDSMGNVTQRMVYWKVQNGQFVDLEKYDCVVSPTCPLMQ